MKYCTSCGEEKRLTEFHERKNTKSFRSQCKSCANRKNSEYRKSHREQGNERQRRWRTQNRELNLQRQYSARRKNPERYKETSRRFRGSVKGKFSTYRESARKRGHEFSLSITLFEKLISRACHYCRGKGGGVDRVNNTLGYVPQNCLPCCEVCNRMKRDQTFQEFIAKCKAIAKNH